MESNYSLFTFFMHLIILKTYITFLHLGKSIHNPSPRNCSIPLITLILFPYYFLNFQAIFLKWDGQKRLDHHRAYWAQAHFKSSKVMFPLKDYFSSLCGNRQCFYHGCLAFLWTPIKRTSSKCTLEIKLNHKVVHRLTDSFQKLPDLFCFTGATENIK